MSVVYRYDIACGEDCRGPGLTRAKDGDWIAFEDYEAVEKQRDDALAEVDRLREVVRQVHGLADDAVRGTAVWEPLVEIHKITKGMVE